MEHKTGLEDQYVIKNHKKLRCGYTTGSCAAAASKAAAEMLFSGIVCEETALLTPKGILLHLLVEEIEMKRDADGKLISVKCAVRKDGGDDPDATNGLLICSEVTRTDIRERENEIIIDGGEGVGRVTRPGLNQPVGAAAINDTPRSMIRDNVIEICQKYDYKGGVKVLITIPEGEETAKKNL